jgi:hypothetical protein
MSHQVAHRTVLIPLLLMTAVDARAQTVKLDPSKLVLPPKATTPSRAVLNRPPAFTKPVRMSQADYLALRPRLATLAKVAESSLPAQVTVATDLATPGNVLNIGVGTPPQGGGIVLVNVSVCSGDLGWLGNGYVPPMQISKGNSYFSFLAPIQGPGLFMMTVYLSAPMANALVPVTTGGGPDFSNPETSPVVNLPVQNGKVFVVKEVTLGITKQLVVTVGPVGPDFVVSSCDFMRVR